MRTANLLCGMLSFLFVTGVLLEDTHGRPKKKRGNGQNEAPAAASEKSEDAASDDAPDEAEPPDEEAPKSISKQLSGEGEGDGGMRRSSRMEFDERLVKGQAAKSGAVYLFKRVPRHLPGLVPMRRSYRKRIVQPILGDVALKPARYTYETEMALKLKKKALEQEMSETKQSATPETLQAAEFPATSESDAEEPRARKRKKK